MSDQENYQGQIGKYHVIGKIAIKGGFADVYKARDSYLNRLVAIKALRYGLANVSPDALTSPDNVAKVEAKMEEKFYEEGRIIARLKHPHIVPIYELNIEKGYNPVCGTNIPYFVMPLAEGDLADYIKGRVFTPQQAVLLLEPVAQALVLVSPAKWMKRPEKRM